MADKGVRMLSFCMKSAFFLLRKSFLAGLLQSTDISTDLEQVWIVH